jgi:hypothetical protein
MRQRVHIGFNPWLEACVAHLAVVGQCAWLAPQHMPAHPLSVQVAGCSWQLVHPWSSRLWALHQTDSLEQGGSWRAQTGHLGWKAHQLSFCLREAAESREDIPSLPTTPRHLRAKALVAIALEPTRVFLPATTAFLSSRRKTWERSMLDVDLMKASYSFSALSLL